MLAKFIQDFPYWDDGGVPPPTKNLLIYPPRHQTFIPYPQKLVQPNKKVKTSFLAVVIAPVPFLF